MAVEDFERQIDELSGRWANAEILIAGILSGATAQNLNDAAAQISVILSQLLSETATWINRYVPEMYRDGALEAADGMALGTPERVVRTLLTRSTHRASMEHLAQGLLDDVARATSFIGADAKRALREVARAQLAKALAQSNPVARVPDFRAQMEEMGVRFVDRGGRGWKPSRYAETVLRTHTATILNQGHINAAVELGSPGVRVFDGRSEDSDEPCKQADGQVWTLPYAAAHRIEHPNCVRAFAALPSDWTGKIDRGLEVAA